MIDLFTSKVASVCKNENVFLYWKGRVALYALLKAIGVQEGDEIIVPAYTCVVVPNAILYLGAKPVYVDIDPDTYTINPSLIERALSKKTKAILCQNTYGLSANLEKISKIAIDSGIYTIEDAAHGFGGTYNGKPNGSFCDAAFFSTQWNKQFSTGIGGIALVNNTELLSEMYNLEKKKIPPSPKEKILLKILYFIRKNIMNERTYWAMVKLYRFLSRKNLILGSSQGTEISSIKEPPDYFKDFSNIQAKKGLEEIDILPQVLALRKRNAGIYTDYLSQRKKNHVAARYFSNHSFLKYPLLVQNRREFIIRAEKAHIQIGDWFLSGIHPVKCNTALWNYNPGQFPVASNIAQSIVNVPTGVSNTSKVIAFLDNNKDLICN